MTEQSVAAARRELLALEEELAGQYWRGGWWGEMDYILWKMVHDGATDGWPAESLPTDQQLRRLRDLSQQAGGWWHRRPVAELQEGKSPGFVPLPIWRRHYRFVVIALPFAGCLAWVFVLLCSIFMGLYLRIMNPTWSALVSWPVGVLVGLFAFAWGVVCFSNWPRMILWLLRPIDWLLTGRRLW